MTADPTSPGLPASSPPPHPLVWLIVGTRPEAVKMAPVLRALRTRPELRAELVTTGQHAAMVTDALAAFGIVPDRTLGWLAEGRTLHDVAIRCLDGLRREVEADRPDLILVQGDTASVFFGALAAFLDRIPVGHVEAGLRSGDREHPWPEEVFRILTAGVADLHFAPTAGARANLLREGIDPARIRVTGNTVVDALLELRERRRDAEDPGLRAFLASGGERRMLLTAHRRESAGEGFERIFAAVAELALAEPGLRILFPVHPNPAVSEPARRHLGALSSVHLVSPLTPLDLSLALDEVDLVLTDSGGIQEEAPTFGTPVLVLRETTERPEGLAAGVSELVGTDPERIVTRSRAILARGRKEEVRTANGASDAWTADGSGKRTEKGGEARGGEPGLPNPYGDGRAAHRIADAVAHFLTGAPLELPEWSGEEGNPR